MNKNNFNLKEILTSKITPSAAQIAEDPSSLETAMRTLLSELKQDFENTPFLLTNYQLESIYSASTALGFTLWQHMAAVERLLDHHEWQTQNPSLWNKISTSENLVGLGTTHLAHANGSILKGEIVADGFLITGNIPWVTGTGMFDYLLLAFETKDTRVFSIIPFPKDSKNTDSSVSVIPHKLACINGTSTSKINFTKFLIKSEQIIFYIDKNAPRPQRQSRYLFPELGMALAALNAAEEIIISSTNSRHIKAKTAIESLNNRLFTLREKIKDKSNDVLELTFEKDELIRDSVRFLLLTAGGSAMSSSSLASRLQLETMLLDVLIQDPRLIEKKLTTTTCA